MYVEYVGADAGGGNGGPYEGGATYMEEDSTSDVDREEYTTGCWSWNVALFWASYHTSGVGSGGG